MARTNGLYQWTQLVTSHFSELTKSQCRGLAEYSFGMVLARSSGLTMVATSLAVWLGCTYNAVRQRLRELYQPARVKSGRQRRELDLSRCFAPLLRWITSGWTDKRLVIVLDPTNIGQRFTVLCVSVVCWGCAIPVAWHVQGGLHKGSWNRVWKRLLFQVKNALGEGWQVLTLTDRGLESRGLFQTIVHCGFHPLMRVKGQGTFRPDQWLRYRPVTRFASKTGPGWKGAGVMYQGPAQLSCTLLTGWDHTQNEAVLVITDLPPAAAEPAWYAFRAWIEQGFKVLKSGGWNWDHSRVTDPKRAARQWVVLALATLWLIEVGGQAHHLHVPKLKLPAGVCRKFRLGWIVIMMHLNVSNVLPRGYFQPETWLTPAAQHTNNSTRKKAGRKNLPL